MLLGSFILLGHLRRISPLYFFQILAQIPFSNPAAHQSSKPQERNYRNPGPVPLFCSPWDLRHPPLTALSPLAGGVLKTKSTQGTATNHKAVCLHADLRVKEWSDRGSECSGYWAGVPRWKHGQISALYSRPFKTLKLTTQIRVLWS